MKKLQAYNVDIEALPDADLSVEGTTVENDLVSIQGSDWERPDGKLDYDDPLVQSLIQWLGRDAVEKMRKDGFQALKRAISTMRDPVSSESFVWDAIKGPEDILRVSEAVVSYRQFDQGALIIADAMGGNTEIRNVIRTTNCNQDDLLKDFLITEKLTVDRIDIFNERLASLAPFMEAMFGAKDFSVGSAVVAIAAVKGFVRGLSRLEAGFVLSQPATEDFLSRIEYFREEIVRSAEVVKNTCKVSPLRFSLGVLSGVRRSLVPGGAGDFRHAVRSIGGTIETEDDLVAAASAFSEFLSSTDDFNRIVVDAGFDLEEVPQILSHLMARRHLMSSARSVGIPWSEVADALSIDPQASLGALGDLIGHVSDDGLTGRLKAVSKDYSKKLQNVRDVGEHHVVSRRYWLDAGDRVAEIDPEITIGDLKELVRIEPQIAKSKDLLKACGAASRDDIDTLEQHLEWMTAAYALPIEDHAFDAIIASRAEVIPLRLSQS